MKGKIVELFTTMDGKYRITLELFKDKQRKTFLEKHYDYLKDKELTITIEKYRKRRSANASAYFHILAGKIAEERDMGAEEVKKQLVLEYGTLAKDEDGLTVGFKLPVSVDVATHFPYTYVKCFDTRTEDGKDFNCYLCYKQTSLMNSKEMYRLILGTIEEAQELGIETATPEELARFEQEERR